MPDSNREITRRNSNEVAHNGNGLLLGWYLKFFCPNLSPNVELKMKVNNKCSINILQPEQKMTASKKMKINSSASLEANRLLCAAEFVQGTISCYDSVAINFLPTLFVERACPSSPMKTETIKPTNNVRATNSQTLSKSEKLKAQKLTSRLSYVKSRDYKT